MMVRTGSLAGWMLVLAVLLDAAGALADPGQPDAALVVDGTSGKLDLPLHPEIVTIVHFSSPVLDVVLPAGSPLRAEKHAMSVLLRPLRPGPGLPGNVQVLTQAYWTTLQVRTVQRPEEAFQSVEVTQRDPVAEHKKKLDALHAQRVRELQAYKRSLEQQTAAERAQARVADLAAGNYLQPGDTSSRGGPLRLHITGGYELRDEFYVEYEIENSTPDLQRAAEMHVIDANGLSTPVQFISINPPAVPEQGALGMIPAGRRVSGVLMVPRAAERPLAPMRLMLGPAAVPQPVVASVQQWLVPKPLERIEAERRDTEASGRVSLHAQALAGFMWLTNPLATAARDATTLQGLGMRVTYGFTRYLALEAEVVGGRTGESRFANVSWNDLQGDLVRSAGFGRAQFGGVVRLGHQYIPVLRAGLGLQATGSKADFITASGERMDGPDVPIDWRRIVSLGVGFDVRFGDFLAGVQLSAMIPGEVLQSLEAGIHLGYGWKP